MRGVLRPAARAHAIAVCHLALAANLPVAPHVSPELSITVAAAVPNSVFVEYIPQMEPLLKRTLQRRDGYGIPFDTPGHGIEFDPDALERFTVKRIHGPATSRGRHDAGTTLAVSEREP